MRERHNILDRSIRFRDANKNAWTVRCEIGTTDCERRNRVTLQTFRETKEVSFTGEGGMSAGQCNGHIEPRTECQKELLNLWDRYHLCGMGGGTEKQEEYLLGSQYKTDFDRFVETFKGYDIQFRKACDKAAWDIIQSIFQYDVMSAPWVAYVVNKEMKGNPLTYILGDGEKHYFNDTHDKTDYYVKCFFLALRGLYKVGDYEYGTGWLYEPIPENIVEIVNKVFDVIEAEEAALTESLTPVFDMGAEDFKATPSVINQVMELRDCTETEAKRFLALGMKLGCTFGDLDNTFEEIDEDRCLYQADGIEYYVGTDTELYDVAWGQLSDGDWDYLWREAVQAEKTEMGLNEWLKYVIDMDGWCNILNGWDGRYEDYEVGDEWICVSRT